MNENSFDRMMKRFCDPETDAFVYHERKNHRISPKSAIAAALVLALISAMLLGALFSPRHSLVLEVSAAENRLSGSESGKVYSEVTVYDTEMNLLDRYYEMEAEMLLSGDDIADVSFRSLNGCGRFFVWYDPDFENYSDDWGMWYDPDGNEDPFYIGRPNKFGLNEYYSKSDPDYTADWNRQYQYHISYVAVGDDGYFLQPEEISAERDDMIEITVTFRDGDTQTKCLSVTYPDGVMAVREIN